MSERCIIPPRRPFSRRRQPPRHQIGLYQSAYSRGHQSQHPRRYHHYNIHYHHQHHRYHRLCYRCGDVFHHAHLSHCRARFVRCFSCFNFGHFSRMCANHSNIHVRQIPHHDSRPQLQNHPVTVHHTRRRVPRSSRSSRQANICTINRASNNINSSELVVSEPDCLGRELPFSTISQAALIPEISDREFKLENKLRAVMDRMEINKDLHDAECQVILEMRDKQKETAGKFEEQNNQLSKTCSELKIKIEQTVLENKSLKTKCDQLCQDLEDFKNDNSLRINSISKIEEEKQHLGVELKTMEQTMIKIQEERDYWIEKSDLYKENNYMLSTETIKMREEIKQLKQNKNNNRSHQKRF